MSTPHHPEFLAQLDKAEHTEIRVAMLLNEAGLEVEIGDRPRAPDWEAGTTGDFSNKDLLVGPRRLYVEVKSSAYDFTGPEDWPWPWGAYVCSTRRWERMKADGATPVGIIVISDHSDNTVVIPPSTEPQWTRRMTKNYIGPYEVMVCPRECLRTLSQFTRWLSA